MTSMESIAGLIPAAGASRRLGQDKRRVPFRGATVLESVVEVLRTGGASPIVVVLEPDSPCRELPALRGCTLVENPDPSRGMLSSIREGLARLPAAAVAAAVLPGDHALVPAGAVSALLEHFRRVEPRLLVPTYAGRRGHPLVLHRELYAEAAACDDAVGLRGLLARRAELVRELPFEAPAAEQDLDEPLDLVRLRELE